MNIQKQSDVLAERLVRAEKKALMEGAFNNMQCTDTLRRRRRRIESMTTVLAARSK